MIIAILFLDNNVFKSKTHKHRTDSFVNPVIILLKYVLLLRMKIQNRKLVQ